MPEAQKYIVRQGDCISSIASERGFFWKTLWDENTELQQKRDNPNAILPGDIVIIPEKRLKEETGVTEVRHRFRKRGEPAKFRLIVEDNGRPLAGKPYTLEIDGRILTGTTTQQGLIEASIAPGARSGRLCIEGREFAFGLGTLDPGHEILGLQGRLQNLGFYFGELNGTLDDETKHAIEDFQAAVGLPATGQLDDNTRRQILERHDQMHAPSTNNPSEPEPPDEASEPPPEEEVDEAMVDEAEDEELFKKLESSDDDSWNASESEQ